MAGDPTGTAAAPGRVRLALLGIFIAGLAAGRLAWDHIALPFHNPWGVVSPLTLARFNPSNNAARFFVLIALPALLLLGLFLVSGRVRELLFAKRGGIEDDENEGEGEGVGVPLPLAACSLPY